MTALPPASDPPRAVHVFVDLENNQPTLDEVRALVPDLTDVWLFHSGMQSKHLAAFESLGPRQMAVPIARPGKNSLDFHLSFYLGYIAAKNPGARLVVVAIDGGYAPMIEHAVKTLGFDVDRVSVKPPVAKKTAAKKAAKPVAKKATPAKKAGKNVRAAAGTTKGVAPTKKAPKKTLPTKNAPTKTAAKKPAPAAKKVVPGAAPQDKLIDRLAKALVKMGAKAPSRSKAFRQHLKSMLGADAEDDAIDAAVAALAKRGVAKVDGEKVKYDFGSASGG
jgi:hypothetical protein